MIKKITTISLCLLLANTALADNGPLTRTEYVYNDKQTYSFGYKTDTSKTFVYQTKLEGEVIRRLEFNISSFPFNQTLEIPSAWNKKEVALNKLKQDNPDSMVTASHFGSPTQSFHLSVTEVIPGLYAPSFKIKNENGFSATKLAQFNQVIALANSSEASSSGGSMRIGERGLSAKATPRGWEETTWFFTE